MSENPYVQFYTSDFLAGTGGMTAATKGVYITLLCMMYEAEEPLSQSWKLLSRRCGCTISAFKKAVADLEDDGKLVAQNGTLWSPKCEKHIALRHERRDSAKAAAKKRWEKTEQKQLAGNAPATPAHCQPEPEPEPYNTLANAKDAVGVVGGSVFDIGFGFLSGFDYAERQARTQIGRWRKDATDEAILSAIRQAQDAETHDPIPYITKILQPKQNVVDFAFAQLEAASNGT